ncbi:unnamed protein product [Adineta steineri]|uniref:Uncharacterized protein n=1 Tax=Adineta steineri TaxID=433720 RepID=A0A819FZJ9_9BILA|nr:unnamed protein product [Adineta steineri]CAF3874956.1 unnamed protein product [Adineta steineri]
MKYQYEQTQDELFQRTKNLTTINETLKEEAEKLKDQNEVLVKNATVDSNNKKNENPDMIDQFTKQVNDLRQMYASLLEKKANDAQKYIEEKEI